MSRTRRLSRRVSIHSPRRSEGRRPITSSPTRRRKFQSTPLAEARGDNLLEDLLESDRSFNPLPSPKRGETRTVHSVSNSSPVSIHSPRRSEGRPRQDEPTHPPHSRFNPLPSPKRGETFVCIGPSSTNVFQSTPLAEARGDLLRVLVRVSRMRFQSTPLAEARGDTPLDARSAFSAMFQSTPLAEARGDRPSRRWSHPPPVSIHSPRRSEGRHHKKSPA